MFTNVNLSAPLGVLSFLGTGFLLFLVVLTLIVGVIKKKSWLTKLAVLSVVVVCAIYLGVMLLFSVSSNDLVLARGQEKHFCEIDCHLAYSITDVQQPKVLGQGTNLPTAAGLFTVVTIKTRFDEKTISPTRGNSPLYPNSRVLVVIDENGKQYFPSPAGQAAVATSQAAGSPFTTPLRPGESYTSSVVFDLPPNIMKPTLLIREGEWLTHFVIGHENSLLHKTTRFQI